MGNANKKGILVRGGRYLEAIGDIRAIAFDKTRTLTKGAVTVVDIIPLNGYTKEGILQCAGALEHFSEHPLAVGVLKKIKEMAIDYKPVKKFSAVSGKGVQGDCYYCNSISYLGSPSYIDKHLKINKKTKELVDENESNGRTVLVVGNEKRVQGLIICEDEIKKEGKDLVAFLNKKGINSIMLTGDNKKVATRVGKTLNLKEVYAELLPENKSEKISEIIKKYQKVAMVGDGVNDAPALASSTVGIAMGAAGSDVAIESADIAIMDDNISKLKGLIRLGKKTKSVIRVNIVFSLLIKMLFIILAIAGSSNLVLAIMADVGITIVVILNSLRLFKVNS
jgi:Cd2+/Zn2+-exporting ATPase